jgi:hypothetical protein
MKEEEKDEEKKAGCVFSSFSLLYVGSPSLSHEKLVRN